MRVQNDTICQKVQKYNLKFDVNFPFTEKTASRSPQNNRGLKTDESWRVKISW